MLSPQMQTSTEDPEDWGEDYEDEWGDDAGGDEDEDEGGEWGDDEDDWGDDEVVEAKVQDHLILF